MLPIIPQQVNPPLTELSLHWSQERQNSSFITLTQTCVLLGGKKQEAVLSLTTNNPLRGRISFWTLVYVLPRYVTILRVRKGPTFSIPWELPVVHRGAVSLSQSRISCFLFLLSLHLETRGAELTRPRRNAIKASFSCYFYTPALRFHVYLHNHKPRAQEDNPSQSLHAPDTVM